MSQIPLTRNPKVQRTNLRSSPSTPSPPVQPAVRGLTVRTVVVTVIVTVIPVGNPGTRRTYPQPPLFPPTIPVCPPKTTVTTTILGTGTWGPSTYIRHHRPSHLDRSPEQHHHPSCLVRGAGTIVRTHNCHRLFRPDSNSRGYHIRPRPTSLSPPNWGYEDLPYHLVTVTTVTHPVWIGVQGSTVCTRDHPRPSRRTRVLRVYRTSSWSYTTITYTDPYETRG